MPNSVAVLPFANLDANPDTGYFSTGVTEEILQRLSTQGAVHVLASTSSFAFRDSEEGPASITAKLGVQYLLQGSVRRDDEHVRVTARLIDENGFQVWSNTFDRKLESIFVIQAEIASAVSSRIVKTIVPLQELPDGRTTKNMEAYNEYLRGRAFFDTRSTDWRRLAEEAFTRAIELDPNFAPPYAGLATLVVNSGRGPHWDEARESAKKALQLDPELPLGHATLGLTQTVLGEEERGLESLRKAIEFDPSLGIAYEWIRVPLARLGLDDDALEMQRRGLEVDPLNPIILVNASASESRRGNFDRAAQLLLRLKGLPEPPGAMFGWLFDLYSRWGRYADAVETAKEEVRAGLRTGQKPDFQRLALGYAKLGMMGEAGYWFDKFRSQRSDVEPPIRATFNLARHDASLRWLPDDLAQAEALLATDGWYNRIELLTYGGLAWVQAGDPARGIEWLERGVAMYLGDDVSDQPAGHIDYTLLDKSLWHDLVVLLAQRLTLAYRETGRDRQAQEAIRFLDRDYEITANMIAPSVLEWRAVARAISGDQRGALDHLRQAVELGWANYYVAVNDPVWADTVRAPEFEEVLAVARVSVERQQAIVQAAEAEHDFRAEVEQLLSLQFPTE